MELNSRDGYVVVTGGWILFSLFGTLPFLLTGSISSFTDAFFETISGFTTTGASILNNIEELSHGILFWRSLIQWLGGMGIILLTLILLPFLGIGGMQLFSAEVPSPTLISCILTLRIQPKGCGLSILFSQLQRLYCCGPVT